MGTYDKLKEAGWMLAHAPETMAKAGMNLGAQIGERIERSHMASPPPVAPAVKNVTHAGKAMPKRKPISPCGPN